MGGGKSEFLHEMPISNRNMKNTLQFLNKKSVSINPIHVKQHAIKKGLLKVGGWPVHSLKLYFQVKYLQRGQCHFDEMGNFWLKS